MQFPIHGESGFVRRVLIVIGIGALTLLLWYLVDVLLLVFGAIVTAVLLRSAARPIEQRTRLSEGWALTVATVVLCVLLGLAAMLFGTEVRAQIIKLVEILPEAWDLLMRQVLTGDLGEQIMSRAEDAAPAAGQMLSGLVIGAYTFVGGVSAVALMIVGGLYLAAQPEVYRDGLLLLFPDDGKRTQLAETLDAVGEALELWLFGQLVTMALIFVVTLVGLWLIGLPAALALAVFAGLAQFVPIIGPIVAAVPALLIALTEGWQMVLWTLGLYIVIQQIEGNLLTPLIQRRTVSLPPAIPLFAVVVFGLLFGLMGVLFATPLAVVAYVAVKKLWVRDALGEDTHLPGEPKPEEVEEADEADPATT